MNGNNGHLLSVLIEEEAVRDELGHVRFHERRQVLHGYLELLVLPLADRRGVDVDDGLRHQCSLVAGLSAQRLWALTSRSARPAGPRAMVSCRAELDGESRINPISPTTGATFRP